MNACASLAYDIFVLSHCIVDSKISNEIDNIFNVNIRPYDFINNKDVINNKINCIFRSLASLDNSKMNSNNTENLKLTIEQKLDLIVNSLSEVKSSVYDLKTNLNTLNNEHAILKNTLTEKIKEVCSEMINSQSQATKLVSNSNIEHETSKSPQPGHKRPRNESSEKNVSTPKSIVSALNNRNRNISYKRSNIDLDGTSLNKKGILGANDKISFKTGIIPFNVYVGNVSLETDDEEVLSLFKNNGIKVIGCTKIQTRSRASKAFRVTISKDYCQSIYNPQLWPKNLIINRFTFSREEKDAYRSSLYTKSNYRHSHSNNINSIPDEANFMEN